MTEKIEPKYVELLRQNSEGKKYVRCNQPLQYQWNGRLGPVLGVCRTVYNFETGDVAENINGMQCDRKLKINISEYEIYDLHGGIGCAGHNKVGTIKIGMPVEEKMSDKDEKKQLSPEEYAIATTMIGLVYDMNLLGGAKPKKVK